MKTDGFTLMEVVLVLAVLMAGLGIGLPAFNHFAVQKEEKQFFQLLRNDVYYAQSEAYRTGKLVRLDFKAESGRYIIEHNLHARLVSRKLPASVSVKISNLTKFAYSSNGSVSDSGTIRFETSTGEKTMIVHLGKGRVVFSE